MRGIVLAGGAGTRLHPITLGVSKQLLPIYDKPMIYYPISVLMLAGIKDILLITTPEDQSSFKRLLGDGSNFGINLQYAIQEKPNGIAQAFIIGKEFIGSDDVCLILGDNIFHGAGFSEILNFAIEDTNLMGGAKIFGYKVKDPERYGVAEIKNGKVLSIEEKPKNPKSNIAVVGLYMYDNSIIDIVEGIKPSARGELEITDVNKAYLQNNDLYCEILPRGFAWLDTGTIKSMNEASEYIGAIQERQGTKIACLEEIAYRNGWLTKEELSKNIKEKYPKNSEYTQYIENII